MCLFYWRNSGLNQPATNLKIINGLQRNQQFLHQLCPAKEDACSASMKSTDTKHQQEHVTRWPESLCFGARSSTKPLQLLWEDTQAHHLVQSCCSHEGRTALGSSIKLTDSLPSTTSRQSSGLWKSHMLHNSECAPRRIRDKHLFPSPSYRSSAFYSSKKKKIAF